MNVQPPQAVKLYHSTISRPTCQLPTAKSSLRSRPTIELFLRSECQTDNFDSAEHLSERAARPKRVAEAVVCFDNESHKKGSLVSDVSLPTFWSAQENSSDSPTKWAPKRLLGDFQRDFHLFDLQIHHVALYLTPTRAMVGSFLNPRRRDKWLHGVQRAQVKLAKLSDPLQQRLQAPLLRLQKSLAPRISASDHLILFLLYGKRSELCLLP
jgi:hypothetical protein